MSRSVMLAAVSMSPASRKNGIARNSSELMPVNLWPTIDARERLAEHAVGTDQAVERLDQEALAPGERLADRGEPEVLVAPHRHPHAEEDAPGEEPARELVGVQPRPAEVAEEHVGHLADREAQEEERAEDHEP